MILYCLRHGRAEHNTKRVMNDDPSKPVHLTEEGKQQAQEAAEKLKNIDFEIIFTSEFPRTKETAEIINKHHNAPTKVDKRLNDIISGFEGKPLSEWLKSLKKDRYSARVKGGESFQDVKKRAISFIKDLKSISYEKILIVSHGEVLMAIRGYLEKLSDHETLKNPVHTGEILKFEI